MKKMMGYFVEIGLVTLVLLLYFVMTWLISL